MRRIIVIACTLASVLWGARGAQAQDTLRLPQLYQLVSQRNLAIRAATARVDAKHALARGAGILADPQVEIGAMNLAVPGLSADMPNSMAPSIGVMQMLPPFGKRGLERQLANQDIAVANAENEELVWQVRSQTAMSFYELLRADREAAVMRETLQLLRNDRQIAQAMYASGEGRQADVLRAGVEIARMEAELARMQTMRSVATARLNVLIAQPADAQLGSPELPVLPGTLPPIDTLRAWAELARPMLAAGRAEVARARTRVALARKEVWPDMTVGLQYGRRQGEQMGSITFGFSLPIYAARKQSSMRLEAEAMTRMSEADLADMQLQVDARITELVAGMDRDRTLLKLYATDILPQSRANVQSAFSSYRVGQVDFMTLIDAQMTLNKYRQELATLFAQYGAAVADLEMVVGRVIPVGQPLRVEDL